MFFPQALNIFSSPGRWILFIFLSIAFNFIFIIVQLLCCVLTLCDPRDCSSQASLPFSISWSLLKLTSVESMMPFNHLVLCHPLLLLPSIFPSIRVFSNESVLSIRWPKFWSFSFSISPSNEYSGLICFRIDWFDLLEHYWTLKSFLQHHSLKASAFRCSAFFMVQLSHPYMPTGQTTALTILTWLVYTLGTRQPQPRCPDRGNV